MTTFATAPDRIGRRRRVFVVTAVSVFALDIVSKVAASAWLDDNGIDLPGPLDLRLAYNSGLAFSLGSNAPLWLMLALTTGVAAVIAVAAWRGMFPSAVAVGVIVGGAVANVADRYQGGTVVDMLHTGWWPTFNLADVAVVCGAAALALATVRAPDEQASES